MDRLVDQFATMRVVVWIQVITLGLALTFSGRALAVEEAAVTQPVANHPALRRRSLQEIPPPPPSICPTINNATISGRQITYCYPPSLTSISKPSTATKPTVVVGVLSAAINKDRRDLIRDTWAKGDYHVYFLVSGEWSHVADEVLRYKDVFWVNATEAYRMVTYKVHVLLHAVHTLSGGYDHVFKTDDDSYVYMDGVEMFLGERNPDYWGRCVYNTPVVHYPPTHKWYVSRELYPPDIYPPYALGGGYSLSESFNECVVGKLAEFSFMPNEDAGVGILAEQCEVKCTSDIRIRPTNPKPVVLYGLQQDRDLDFLHELKRLGSS